MVEFVKVSVTGVEATPFTESTPLNQMTLPSAIRVPLKFETIALCTVHAGGGGGGAPPDALARAAVRFTATAPNGTSAAASAATRACLNAPCNSSCAFSRNST